MKSFRIKFTVVLLLVLCAAIAHAVTIPQPSASTWDKTTTGTIPDLNQRRDYTGDGNPEAKWCAPTASADSVWYYGSGSYPLLIPAGASDSAKADSLITTLGGLMGTTAGGTAVTGVPSAVDGLQKYYDSKYPGRFDVGLVTAWTFLDGTGAPSAQNLWNWMTTKLNDCNDVLPIISFGNPPASESSIPDYLDTTNAHLVMMTGYDYTPMPDTITMYDPDDDASGAHAFPSSIPAPVAVNSGVTITGPAAQGTALSLHPDGVSAPFIVGAIISGPSGTLTEEDREYGDAPEGSNAIAYPSLGTTGNFPTCKTIGTASSYIEHNNFGAYFGASVDFESDGNAGACPTASCFPPYDQDECFDPAGGNVSDPGLMTPVSFTIDAAGTTVVSCPQCTGTSLGQTCNTAMWGTDIDIWVHNTMPNHDPYLPAYINVLVDWNQDGQWGGSSTCSTSGDAPEHVLQNFVFPANTISALSAQMAGGSGFLIGPNSGYVWVRFTITEQPVTLPWTGEGVFEDGESEDYLLLVDPSQEEVNLMPKFVQLPQDGPDYFGHDELSTMYLSFDPEEQPLGFEGCYMADDFADNRSDPVIRLKWWGSYMQNVHEENDVTTFLIVFETDVPADTDLPYSHPGDVILSQEVTLNGSDPTALSPGQFSESYVGPGGSPCSEGLYEYEAYLETPFDQEAHTVYWVKIVAIMDIGPSNWLILKAAADQYTGGLCELLNEPWQFIWDNTGVSVPRWGWHNRDYTVRNPYASKRVTPGEFQDGPIYDPASGIDLDIWHFQDDAVSGDIMADMVEEEWIVDQWSYFDENYVFTWPLCTGDGVDGPDGIQDHSKDLAFELLTTECIPSTHPDYAKWVQVGRPECWCYRYQCVGDASASFEGKDKDGKRLWVTGPDLDILLSGWFKFESDPAFSSFICADFNHDFEGKDKDGKRIWVTGPDLDILLAGWFKFEGVPPFSTSSCPGTVDP